VTIMLDQTTTTASQPLYRFTIEAWIVWTWQERAGYDARSWASKSSESRHATIEVEAVDRAAALAKARTLLGEAHLLHEDNEYGYLKRERNAAEWALQTLGAVEITRDLPEFFAPRPIRAILGSRPSPTRRSR
jgi:hypothetical protein